MKKILLFLMFSILTLNAVGQKKYKVQFGAVPRIKNNSWCCWDEFSITNISLPFKLDSGNVINGYKIFNDSIPQLEFQIEGYWTGYEYGTDKGSYNYSGFFTTRLTNQCSEGIVSSEEVDIAYIITPLFELSVASNSIFCGSEKLTISTNSGYNNYQWECKVGNGNFQPISGQNSHVLSVGLKNLFPTNYLDRYNIPLYFRVKVESCNTYSPSSLGYIFLKGFPIPQTKTPSAPICFGGKGSITLSNFKYDDGTAYNGGENLNLSITKQGAGIPDTSLVFSASTVNITGLSPGNYIAQYGNAAGTCSQNFTFTIPAAPAQLTASATLQNPDCSSGSGTITATAGGGTPPYQYSINGGTTYQTSNIFSNLSSGSYTVTITDANNCTPATSAALNVGIPTAVNVTLSYKRNPSGAGLSNGQIVAAASGGTGSTYTYAINDGTYASADTFSGLAAGTYNITAKDSKGCVSAPLSVVLTEPQPLTASLSSKIDNNCFGASLGTIEVSASGGVTPYSYAIGESSYQTSNSFTNLSAGDYSITIKDANGNIATLNTTISQPTKITANVVKTDATCYGGNGNITINNVAGGSGSTYSYSSDGGVNYQSGNVFSLPQGTYTIKIKDENGCSSDSYSITINQPAASLSATATKQDVACYGASNGNLKITATGGSGSYSYSIDNWLTSNTTGEFAGLSAGTYAVKVKDQAGCTFNLSVQINQPQELQLYIDSKTDALCFGGTGTISVSTTGGQGNITYSSTPSLSYSNGLFSGASAGTYVIQITDENGCTKTANVTINQPGQLSITATTTSVSCNGGSDGSVSLSASGGSGTYTYSIKNLNNFTSSSTFNGLAAGSHGFTVKDRNGCTTDIIVTVTQPGALALATSAKSNVTCNGADNGSITVLASGGNGGYTYRLNGTDMGSVSTFTGLAAGSYTISVTDAKGCTREITENITQPNSLVLSLADQTNILCNGGTGSITVGTTGGTAPYQYSIDGTNFQSAPTFSGLAAGSYNISVRDANGCMATLAVELAQPATLALGISTKIDVTCNGSGNGSVTLAATGGTAPYRYRIGNQPLQLSNRFDNLNGGSYTMTVTDANGCTASSSVAIAEPAQLILAASATAVGCNGGSDGSVTLSASGGSGTYTYSIKNNNSFSSSSTFSGLAAGSQSFTAKDQNGCTAEITVTVNQPDALAITTSTKINVTCNGAANGSITVTASGGTAPYRYSLNGSTDGLNSIFTGLAAGSYTIRVTDAKGCTTEITENITQPNSLALSVADQTNILCNGGSNGSITVGATGGTAPYQYAIDGTNYQSTPTFGGLAAGSYNISVRDANGCTANISTTISQPSLLTLGISTKTDVTCSGSGNGSVTLAATGGTAPYRYRIGTAAPQLSNKFDNLAGGSYTLTVTDANGCSTTASFTIAEPAQLSLAASTTAVGCNGGSDGSVSLSASGGTGTYTYSVKNLNSFSTSSTFSGLAAGSHSFTVKDQNGCTTDITVTVTQPDALALATSAKINVTCNGAANGSITVTANGGTAPYRYNLNGSTDGLNSVFTGLAPGSYTIRVTDAKGCTREITETITQPNNLVVSVADKTDILCNGGNTGSVTVGTTGGTSPYQYSIDGTNFQSAPTFSGLAAGKYTFFVKDANNCSATLAVELVQPATLALGISTKTDVTCNGSGNGSVTLAATGGTAPYRYRIGTQPFQLSNRFENLNGGSYTLTVTDANGCTVSTSVTIAEPSQLTVVASTTAVSCNGGSDGSVTLSASGGTGTYTYSIKNLNTFSSSSMFNGLAAGSHSFIVKDQNGCTAETSVNITQPDALALGTSSKSNVTCNGATNGSISVSASGGTAPYRYSLNGSTDGSSSTFTGLAPGSYTIRVTDAKGCTREITENITQPNSLVLSMADQTNILCNGGSTGSITVGATGGTAPYQYSIDGTNFQSAPTFSGLAAGNYNISVKDANGCTATLAVELLQPATLALGISTKTDVTCSGSSNGSVTLAAIGGTAPYRYRIGTQPLQLSNRFDNLASGSYTVSVTDANGCSATTSFTIAEPAQLSLAASTTAVGCNGGSDGSVTLSASGGTGTYTYSIKNNNSFSSSSTFSGLAAGSHSFTVKDQNGCTADITVTVNQPDALAIATSAKSNVTCNGAANGSITVLPSGGNGGYTYQLNGTNMGSNSTFTGLSQGSYTIRVTDAKGCTREITENITQPNSLVLSVTDKTDILCSGGSTGSITVGATGGTAPYQYSIDGTNFQSGTTFGGLVAGSYNISVRDANTCTSTINVIIIEPQQITASIRKQDINCFGSASGSIEVVPSGGQSPYTYAIGSGSFQTSSSFTGLVAGSYDITVRDRNGCRYTSQVQLINATSPLAITLNANSPATCNALGNIIVANTNGGTPPYTYSVDGGSNFQTSTTFNGLSAGTYTILAMDANGCSTSATAAITVPTGISATARTTAATCHGATDGSIIVENTTGGSGVYRYSIGEGIFQSSPNFTGLTAGNYIIVVRDEHYTCQYTINVSVTQPTQITVALRSVADLTCNGVATGTLEATATGGTLPYQYSIDGTNFQSAPTFSGLAAGNYTLTAKDANGCLATLDVELAQPATLALGISTKTDVTCSGSGNGSATLAATGGTAPYRYRIGTQPFQLSNRFENLNGGSYIVTVTDANGCSATASFTIAEPTQLTIAASTTAVGCNGGSDGSVSLSASGGTGTYTYSIKNLNSFSTSSTFSGLAAGSHAFTVKDQNGCTAEITVTVTQPDALALATSAKSNVTCSGAANGSITVSASGGNGGYTYQLNGKDMGSVSTFIGLPAGSYTIRVTDTKGCTREITETITQPNSLAVSVTDKTDILCNGGSTGSITVGATGGTAPYQYSINGTNFQPAPTFSGLAAGNYNISVKDANGCTATLAVELLQPATLALTISTKTDVTCSGSGNGSVTLAAMGGTAPYRYRIGTAAPQLSNKFDNLTGGSYTVTVTDANGCTASTSVAIAEPAQLTLAASTTAVGCNGGSDGSVLLSASGGSGTYTYSIKNLNNFTSSSTFSGLAAGSHSFTVKDQNGCTADITVTVTQPNALALATSAKSNVTCNGAANGSITVSASGGNSGYTYQLNGKDMGGVSTFTGLAAGSYTIRVTDAKGCTREITENITEPSALTVSVTNKTDIVCNGGSTGSVTVGATGGTAPYQYSIDGTNFQSGATFDGLAVGNYTFSVKDANNCSATLAVQLAQPTTLALGISNKTDVTCNESGNGSVTLAATGGTAPYRYRIGTQSLQLSNRFDNLKGGDYNFNVLDANGCAATISIKVVEPAQLTLSASTTAVGCNGGSDGSVSLSASGGTGTYTYSIKNNNNFSSSNTFSGLAAGSHSFTVKDQNGCTDEITVTVNQPDALAIATSAKSNVTCNGAANGSITVSASGGNSGYTYQLNGKDMGSVSTFTGLAAGSYTIRATDAKGCTKEITETITQPNSLVVSVTDKTDILCNGGSTGSVTLQATGGTSPYQYSIDGANFKSVPTFSGLAAGSYNISVRDANNCNGNIVATISQPSLLTLSVSAKTNVTCNGSGNGSVTLVATGGTAPYRYRIGTATFQLSNRFENLAGGSYAVTVTDANGCSTVASFTIAEPSQLSLAASTMAVGCNGGSGGSVSLSASGGTGTYAYSVKNNNNFSSSNTFSGLAAGSHSFTVKDQNGCTTDITVTVTQPEALALAASSKSNVTCNGAANGSITVSASGGNGGYTYQLNGTDMGSNSTFTGLSQGSYTIRVTDAKGCTREITETITQPNSLALSVTDKTDILCNGGSTGGITVGATGGTAPYQYAIDGSTYQSSPTFSGLAAGSYTFTVKDANNCLTNLAATISQPSLLTSSVSSKTDVACNGAKNGTVSLTASGGTAPYRYSIGTSAYQSSNRFENLSGGSYVLSVTDANGCNATSNVTINENPALNIEVAEFKNVTCNGNSSGEITLRASGGGGNYQYRLNNGTYQSSPIFSQLAAGNYQLTVKDEKGCTSSITKMITQPLPLAVSKQVTQQKCFDACSGEIKLEVSGGTAPYTYQWSGGIYGNVSSLNNLCGGLYKVTIVDANGCSIEDATTIVTPPEIIINGIADTILCVDQVITYDAGNPGLTYQWTADNGFLRNTQKVQISQAGKYQLKVTNSDGCFVTKNFTIQTSTTLLKANFLASTFANVGDTVIIIDVSKPTPSKTSWIFESGAVDLGGNATGTVKQIAFNAPGVYNLMMMVSLGQCTDAVQKSITVLPKEQKTAVSDALGYKEELIKEFKAYPNPNAGDFKTIIKLSAKQDIKLTLFDFNGAVVLPTQTYLGKDTYEVDFSQKNLQTGLYIVALEAGNQLKTLKIIKL